MTSSPLEDKEHRLAAWRRGADAGSQATRGNLLRRLGAKLYTAQSLAHWATADGVPSDYWDARADAFAQMIEELEGAGRGNWWS